MAHSHSAMSVVTTTLGFFLILLPSLCLCESYEVYKIDSKSDKEVFKAIPAISRYIQGYDDDNDESPSEQKIQESQSSATNSIVPSIQTKSPIVYPKPNVLYYTTLTEKKPDAIAFSPSPAIPYDEPIVEPAPEYAHIEFPPEYEDKVQSHNIVVPDYVPKVSDVKSNGPGYANIGYDPRVPPSGQYSSQGGHYDGSNKFNNDNVNQVSYDDGDSSQYGRPSYNSNDYSGGSGFPSQSFESNDDYHQYDNQGGPSDYPGLPNDYHNPSNYRDGPPDNYRGSNSNSYDDYSTSHSDYNDYQSGPPSDYRGDYDNGPPKNYDHHSGPPGHYGGPESGPRDYKSGPRDGPPRGYNGPPRDYQGPSHFSGPPDYADAPSDYSGPPNHHYSNEPPRGYNRGPPSRHYSNEPPRGSGPPNHHYADAPPRGYNNGPPSHDYNGPENYGGPSESYHRSYDDNYEPPKSSFDDFISHTSFSPSESRYSGPSHVVEHVYEVEPVKFASYSHRNDHYKERNTGRDMLRHILKNLDRYEKKKLLQGQFGSSKPYSTLGDAYKRFKPPYMYRPRPGKRRPPPPKGPRGMFRMRRRRRPRIARRMSLLMKMIMKRGRFGMKRRRHFRRH